MQADAHDQSLSARTRALEYILDYLLDELDGMQERVEENGRRITAISRAQALLRGEPVAPDRHGMFLIRGGE